MMAAAKVDFRGGSGSRCGAMSLVGGSLLLAATLHHALSAQSSVEYSCLINHYRDGAYAEISSSGSDVSYLHYQSFAGPVGSGWTLSEGDAFGLASVYADAGNLRLGFTAQMRSTATNPNLSDIRVSAAATNRLAIGPGSSGLHLGDPVSLTLTVHLDGTFRANAISFPGKSWSHSEVSAGLSVYNYAHGIDTGEGIEYPPLAWFGASSELEAYDVNASYWGYSYSSSWQDSWQAASNVEGSDQSYSNASTTREHGESFHYSTSHSYDSGDVVILFDATVGDTLDFEAELFGYIDAANDAESQALFGHTFAFAVSSAIDGLGLHWQAVPEPDSLPLLISGTTALVLLFRRRR